MTESDKFNKFLKTIDKFWDVDVWKVNYKNIYNKKIRDVIKNVQNLPYKHIDRDIIINDIKNENIDYIKLHAECIPEYHLLLIQFKKEN